MFDVPTPPSLQPRAARRQQEQQQQQQGKSSCGKKKKKSGTISTKSPPPPHSSLWTSCSPPTSYGKDSRSHRHSFPHSLSLNQCPRQRIAPPEGWISKWKSCPLKVILIHRYFDLQSAGIRAVLLYYFGVQRVYLVEAPMPATTEEAGAFAQSEALPAVYILKPPTNEDTKENNKNDNDHGVEAGSGSTVDDASSSLDFSDCEAYFVQEAVPILRALFPLWDKHGRGLDEAMDWLTTTDNGQDCLERILKAVHASIFTTMVAQPGMVETYARHYVGGKILSAAIKYAAADIIMNLAAKKSALYPNSLREELTWFTECIQKRHPSFLLEAGMSRNSMNRQLPVVLSQQGSLDEEQQEEDDEVQQAEQDSDERDEEEEEDVDTLGEEEGEEEENKSTAATSVTTATTALSSSTTRSSTTTSRRRYSSTRQRHRQRQRRAGCAPNGSDRFLVPIFCSRSYEPGPLDIRLYGALVAAMAVVEDRVRSAPCKGKFRCWIHEDLHKSGALPWFQAVDRMYKLKSNSPLIPEWIKETDVCFYGAS